MPVLREILQEDIAKHGFESVDSSLRGKYGIGVKDIASVPELLSTTLEDWKANPRQLITTHIPSTRTTAQTPLVDESLYQAPVAVEVPPAPKARWSLAKGMTIEDPNEERLRDVAYRKAAQYGAEEVDKYLRSDYGISYAQLQESSDLLDVPYSEWKADPTSLVKQHIFKKVPLLGIELPQSAEELAKDRLEKAAGAGVQPPVTTSFSLPHTAGRIAGTAVGLGEAAYEVGKQGVEYLHNTGAGREVPGNVTPFDTGYNQVLEHIREKQPKAFFSAEEYQNLVDDVQNNIAGLSSLVSFPLGLAGKPESEQSARENLEQGYESGKEFGKGVVGGATGGMYGLVNSFIEHPVDTFAAQPATVLLTFAPIFAKIPIREIPAALRPVVSRITRTLGEVAPESAFNLATPHAIPAESLLREDLAKTQRVAVTPYAMAEPAQSIVAREVVEGGRGQAATTRQTFRGALQEVVKEPPLPVSDVVKVPLSSFLDEGTKIAPDVGAIKGVRRIEPEVVEATPSPKAVDLAFERDAVARDLDKVNKRVEDLQAELERRKTSNAERAVAIEQTMEVSSPDLINEAAFRKELPTKPIEIKLGKAQVAANKLQTKVSSLEEQLSSLEASDKAGGILGEQRGPDLAFPAVHGTSLASGNLLFDDPAAFFKAMSEGDVSRAPQVLFNKYNAASSKIAPMVWEDLTPEEVAFLESKKVTQERFNKAAPSARAVLLEGTSKVTNYPTDSVLDTIIRKAGGSPEVATRVYAAASEDSFSKLIEKKYRKVVVKDVAKTHSLNSREVVALDKHLQELGEMAASGKPVVGVVSFTKGQRIYLTDYVNSATTLKTFSASSKVVLAQKLKYVAIAADALAEIEATTFMGKTLRTILDNIGDAPLSGSIRDRGIALLQVVKSGKPLPIMVRNATDIANLLGSDITNIAREVGVSPEAVTRVSRELANYQTVSSELQSVIPNINNAHAAPGFDAIMRSEILVQRAITNRFNSFIKLNLTGRNLVSATNNFMANTVIEHISTGDPTVLAKIAYATVDFLKWRSSGKGILATDARAFKALESTGLLNSGRLEAELGLLTRKRWGPLAPVSKALETVYNWGDQVFKLNTGFRNFKAVIADIEGLAVGASHKLLVTRDLVVKVTREGIDAFRADFISSDGRIIRTKTGPSSSLDPIVARASMKPALDKYFDLSDVPSHVKWIRGIPWLGLVSPFYSWMFRAVMLPGKGGLPGVLLTETYPIISSSSVASNAFNFGRAVATTIRRGMLLNAAQNIIPNKEAANLFNKMFTYNPGSGPALVSFLGYNSAMTKDISAWNSFAPTMTAFDLAFSLGSPIDAEKGLSAITAEVNALDDKSLPTDEKLKIIGRREFWMQRERGEMTPLNAALSLAGFAGGPLLDISASIRESNRRGTPVNFKKLYNTGGISLLGGTYWRTLQGVVPVIAGWGDPDAYLAGGGFALGSSRALAAGNPSTGELGYVGWYFSQIVGATAYKSSIALGQTYYLAGKKVIAKGFIDFAVDGATTELKKSLENEKNLRVVNLITHGYIEEAIKLKENIEMLKAYIDGLAKLEKEIYYEKAKKLGMFP